MSSSRSKLKKGISYAVNLLLTIIFVALVCLFVFVFITIRSGNQPTIFGYRFYVIATDSMTPELEVGDLIISRAVNYDHHSATELEVGDIITYTAAYGEMKGYSITHRIIESVHFDDEYGVYVVTTKGDKQGAVEDLPVPVENINAVMVAKSEFLSFIYKIFSNPTVSLLLLILPLGVILVVLILRLVFSLKSTPKDNSDEAERRKKIEEISRKAIEEYLENNPASTDDDSSVGDKEK